MKETEKTLRSGTLIDSLLSLPDGEKISRFNEMVISTYSHIDGRDLLAELHPRRRLDIKRRVDGVETWYEGDWLSALFKARNGVKVSEYHHVKKGHPND